MRHLSTCSRAARLQTGVCIVIILASVRSGSPPSQLSPIAAMQFVIAHIVQHRKSRAWTCVSAASCRGSGLTASLTRYAVSIYRRLAYQNRACSRPFRPGTLAGVGRERQVVFDVGWITGRPAPLVKLAAYASGMNCLPVLAPNTWPDMAPFFPLLPPSTCSRIADLTALFITAIIRNFSFASRITFITSIDANSRSGGQIRAYPRLRVLRQVAYKFGLNTSRVTLRNPTFSPTAGEATYAVMYGRNRLVPRLPFEHIMRDVHSTRCAGSRCLSTRYDGPAAPDLLQEAVLAGNLDGVGDHGTTCRPHVRPSQNRSSLTANVTTGCVPATRCGRRPRRCPALPPHEARHHAGRAALVKIVDKNRKVAGNIEF